MTKGTNWQNITLTPCLLFDLWRYFALISVILPLYCLLSIFTWFLKDIYHGWSYLTWSEEHFVKMSSWYYVSFLTYNVICDVILLYFTNFTSSLPFWASLLDFYEIFIRSEVVFHNQKTANIALLTIFTWFLQNVYFKIKLFSMTKGTNWQNITLTPCLLFDLWRYFALISVILPLYCLLSIFTWFLKDIYHGWSYLTWSEEHFVKMSSWYYVSFLTYNVICDVILLYFTNFTSSSPFWATWLDFYKMFIMIEGA